MQHDAPKRLKSVKFSPATSESDSADEGSSRQSRHRRPVRALKNASHLSIQPGLSNAHLVLRRYARLSEDASPNSLSDDEEQELLQSPKVGPSQPIDRYERNLLDLQLLGLVPSLLIAVGFRTQIETVDVCLLQRCPAIIGVSIRCPACHV